MVSNTSPAAVIAPTYDGVRRDRDYFDLSQSEARDALNWIRRDRWLRVRPGVTARGNDTLSEYPLALFQYDHDDESGRIVCVTDDGFHAFNATTEAWVDKTGVTPLTANEASQVVVRAMYYGGERVIIFTNGVDVLKKWDGVTATMENLGGSPPVCGCMAVAFNRLLLGNLVTGPDPSPQGVDVSEYRNPDAGYGGTVQQQFLLDVSGDIVAMESIGNRRVGVYLEDGIYVATATGGEFPFRFDLAYKGIHGPVSAQACIPTPRGHVFLARDATMRIFNGSTQRVLQRDPDDDRINAFIRDTLDFDERTKTWLAYNSVLNELHVHYVPVGSDAVVGGFILNMADLSLWPMLWGLALPAGLSGRVVASRTYAEVVGPYSSHSAPYSAFETTENKVLFQGADGQLYRFDGLTDAGGAIEHYIETGIRSAGDARTAVVIRYANHLIEPTASGQEITVQFGASQFGEDRTLEAAKTLDLAIGQGRGRRETHHRLRGTMFSLRLSGSATSQIEWRGTQVVGDPVGA